jgi:hypothetical protein
MARTRNFGLNAGFAMRATSEMSLAGKSDQTVKKHYQEAG